MAGPGCDGVVGRPPLGSRRSSSDRERRSTSLGPTAFSPGQAIRLRRFAASASSRPVRPSTRRTTSGLRRSCTRRRSYVGNTRLVSALLQAGANRQLRNADGRTPRQQALIWDTGRSLTRSKKSGSGIRGSITIATETQRRGENSHCASEPGVSRLVPPVACLGGASAQGMLWSSGAETWGPNASRPQCLRVSVANIASAHPPLGWKMKATAQV